MNACFTLSGMPIVRPIPNDEKAVCSRLASARSLAGFSQEELAHLMGVTRDQLANIETGRTVLGFVLGWNICKKLGLRQLYLASGGHPSTPFYDLGPLSDLPSPNASFRQACLSGPIADLLNHVDALQGRSRPSASVQSFERAMHSLIVTYLMRYPDSDYPELYDQVYSALHRFDQERKRKVLPTITELCNTAKVKSEMELLRVRLVKATEPKGKKTELAKFLDVPLSRVSEWLSENGSTPNGETTLLMLRWAEQQERQNKIPDSAINTTGGKTGPKKTHHEETHPKDRKR